MKSLFLLPFLAMLLAVFTDTAVAAEPKKARPLSDPPDLDQADLVAAVLERNASLEEARAAAEAAARRVEPAGALADPVLSYSAAPGTIGKRDRDFGQRAEISQSLPWPGKLDTREHIARQEARAEEAGAALQRLRVISATKAAYAEWYFIHEAIRLSGENQAILQDLGKVAESRYAAGRGLQQDVLQAETELALLADRLLALEEEQSAVQARMNALLNRAPDTPVPPPGALPDLAPPPLPRLIAAARQHHPRLRRLEHLADARTAGVELARREFYPDFRVTGGFNSLWDPGAKRYTLGVSINIPLDQSRRREELKAAQAQKRQAQWRLADERARLLNALTAAHARSTRLAESVSLYQQRLVPLAQRTLETAVAEYRSGAGDFLNVITAERTKLEAEQAEIRRRADTARRLAELEERVGLPLAEIAGSMPRSGPLAAEYDQ